MYLLLSKGGYVGVILLLLLIYVVACFLYQICYFIRNKGLLIKKALELMQESLEQKKSEVSLKDFIDETDSLTIFTPLQSQLYWLRFIINVAPLLGLLGTVLGIINSTQGILDQNSDLLLGGIAESLITTAFGLCVSIPALLVSFLGRRQLDEMFTQIKKKILIK
jgi:biopolymer transport protein ExbB/TolQ